MKTLLLLCLIPAMLFAADFPLEDFSSYSVGDDIGDNADWDRDDEGEYFRVAEYSGDNVLVLDNYATNGLYAGYSCDGASIWLDGVVNMDYRFSGDDSYFALSARAFNDQAYIAGIQIIAAPIAMAFTAIIDGSGNYTELSWDALDNVSANTWHSLSFEISGTDPVILTLYLNGNEVTTHSDSTYLYQVGWAGFGAAYENDITYIYADNYSINDYSVAVEETTFGEIKAMF